MNTLFHAKIQQSDVYSFKAYSGRFQPPLRLYHLWVFWCIPVYSGVFREKGRPARNCLKHCYCACQHQVPHTNFQILPAALNKSDGILFNLMLCTQRFLYAPKLLGWVHRCYTPILKIEFQALLAKLDDILHSSLVEGSSTLYTCKGLGKTCFLNPGSQLTLAKKLTTLAFLAAAGKGHNSFNLTSE